MYFNDEGRAPKLEMSQRDLLHISFMAFQLIKHFLLNPTMGVATEEQSSPVERGFGGRGPGCLL